ncbi:MAG: CHASE2 domain-containing protein [Candidatus Magasanikbacteria bacterium]|nr:CHASE2 domain-containing protein [Candidatus Magasanikbacteria bacterium]
MRAKYFYAPIGLVVGLLSAWLFWLGIFSGPENFFEDLLFSHKPIDSRLVILAIDNESLQKIGQWPWPRSVFAEALKKINEAPPRALGFDILFAEPSRYGERDDATLGEQLAKIDFPVILPVEANNLFLSKEDLPMADFFVEPLAVLLGAPRVSLGQVNIVVDKDGVARKFPLEVRGRQSGKIYKSIAYETAAQSGSDIPQAATLKLVNRIVYAAPAGSVRLIPFWRLLEEGAGDLLKDKIVFLGVTAPDLHDTRIVPFGRENDMAGVELQANVANMLLQGYRITQIPKAYNALWIIIAALLPALFFGFFRRLRWAVAASCLLGFAQVLAVIYLFQKGLAANIVHLTLAWILSVIALFGYRYFVGEKEKHQLKDIFSRYVSKEVVKEIMDDPSKVRLGGEEKEITVFFSDIRSFTTLSEKTPPVKLVALLNRYFTSMTEQVLEHKGVLDKYIGDAIMAFWGAPIDDPDQVDHALQASVAMLKKLEKLNGEFVKEGKDPINIGIGVYTGPAVVGNMGSELRFNYTAMGDTVNVASRLEGLNKEFKTKIIVGEIVKNRATGNYNWRSLGSVQVKGRAEPVNIFTIDF